MKTEIKGKPGKRSKIKWSTRRLSIQVSLQLPALWAPRAEIVEGSGKEHRCRERARCKE